MTNKPMLSVERELLERVAAESNYMLGFTSASNYDECRAAVDELRALLDNPAALPDRYEDRAYCEALEQERDYLREQLKRPAAQHQGEPVAYRVVFNDGEKSKWEDGMPQSQDLYDVRDGVIRGVERAYAEQPAPVAVVIPSQLVDTWNGNRDDMTYDKGWNDCLAEVARLNGAKS